MSKYLISVLIVAVALTVAQLAMPKGRLKTTVEAAVSVVFIAALVMPFTDLDFVSLYDVDAIEVDAEYSGEVKEIKMEKYCEKYLKERLKTCDLIAEKVEVEFCRAKICKVNIYLSNLVIEENNEHINITVITNYVAEKLSIAPEIINVYV